MSATEPIAEKRQFGTRQLLALTVVVASLVVIVVISSVLIASATAADRQDAARLVFTSVLPLLGTWVGTVLAFYFARDNLDAATSSTIRLRESLHPETPVSKVMIQRSKITAHLVPPGTDPGTVALSVLSTAMTASGFQRIPILITGDKVVYVVHSSTVAAFAASVGKMPNALTETINDLVGKPTFSALVSAIGFVELDDTVGTARAKMGSIANCNDVFVTSDGSASGAVVGWLTNTDLASLS